MMIIFWDILVRNAGGCLFDTGIIQVYCYKLLVYSFGSLLGSDYYGPVREHSNQDQIWCVSIREYMVFGSIPGSDYYGTAGKRSSQNQRWCLN